MVKKKFDGIIHDTKVKLDEGKEKAKGLIGKFEELEQLFIADKVATVEAIKDEKKKFLKAVDEIETEFKG